MEAKQKKKILGIPPFIPCPHCNANLEVVEQISFDYFHGIRPPCSQCDKEVDWWEAILRAVKMDFFLAQMLAPIGAKSVVFKITLVPENTLTINFGDYGIPNDAKILEINYTPQGNGLFPLEMHGNTPLRHLIRHEMVLYPIPFQKAKELQKTVVNVMATWVPHTADDEAWQNLVDSFEAYTQKRYSSCIVPANVAVESKLARLLTTYLRQFASKRNVEDFLENAATYSHQLNVILPLAISQLGLPALPENIRGLLNRLRGLRNEIAHTGKTENQLNKDDTSELIVTALFGFHYLRLLEDGVGAGEQSNNALQPTQ